MPRAFSLRPFLFSVLLLSPISSLDARSTKTLVDVVREAVQHSPSLQARTLKTRSAQAFERQSRANRWPVITARSAFTRSDDPVYVFGTLLRQGSFGAQNFDINSLNHPSARNNISNSLEMSAPLFSSFRMSDSIRISRLEADRERFALKGERQDVRFQTAHSYLKLLLKRQLVQAADQAIRSAQAEIASAQRLKERGLVLGSDYFAAQAILSGLKDLREEWQSSAEIEQEQLNLLMGRDPQTLIDAADRLGTSPYLLPALSDLVQRTLSLHPTVTATDRETEIAAAVNDREKRSLLPEIEAFGSVTNHTQDFSNAPTHHLGGVRMAIPFGDLSYPARREKTRVLAESAEQYAAALRLEITAQLTGAYRQYESSQKRLDTARETVRNAEESLGLFRPLYREGRQSILEVVRAEESLLRANTRYLETLLQMHAGYLRIHYLAGDLEESTLLEVQSHLSSGT